MNPVNVTSAIKSLLTSDFNNRQFEVLVGKTEDGSIKCDIRCTGRNEHQANKIYAIISDFLDGVKFNTSIKVRVTDNSIIISVDGGTTKKIML